MRRRAWVKGDDTLPQKFGYLLDIVMNSAFKMVLYLVNIFILFFSEETADILLNALAIEFVHELDEEIAKCSWWDGSDRWLKAGCTEMILRNALRLEFLGDAEAFRQEYHVSLGAYMEAMKATGDLETSASTPIVDIDAACQDMKNPKYAVDEVELLWMRCAAHAKRLHKIDAVHFFEGRHVSFGAGMPMKISNGLQRLFGPHLFRSSLLFERFRAYRTWSRWDGLLYAGRVGPIPFHTLAEQVDKRGSLLDQVSQHTSTASLRVGTRFEWASKLLKLSKSSDQDQMMLHVIYVISFAALIHNVKEALKRGERVNLISRIIHGAVDWAIYVLMVAFPFLILFCIVLIPYCY